MTIVIFLIQSSKNAQPVEANSSVASLEETTLMYEQNSITDTTEHITEQQFVTEFSTELTPITDREDILPCISGTVKVQSIGAEGDGYQFYLNVEGVLYIRDSDIY